jgi:oligo-1,6-glucosidase
MTGVRRSEVKEEGRSQWHRSASAFIRPGGHEQRRTHGILGSQRCMGADLALFNMSNVPQADADPLSSLHSPHNTLTIQRTGICAMNKAWWKQSVVYQIYPRSFADSNGDGIGDLPGITSRLDYLQALGVDVVWLSPVYKSPNDDNGYDISDYRDIMDEFGSMADFDTMLAGMHQRGIKLMMDLVVNHTSDEHAWFVEACKGKDNPYRDYYIWRSAGPEGGPPNNWEAAFTGSAWQWHEPSGQYYLHMFSPRQPDLNWENPKLRQEVYALMRFWLDKGVDGFRMDVINMISKPYGADGALPDAPVVRPGFLQPGFTMVANGPRLLEFLREMKQEVLSKYDTITVGEAPMATTLQGVDITHQDTGALNMLFQFEHMELDAVHGHVSGKWAAKPLNLLDLKHSMSRWQHELAGRGWNSLYLSNHDQPRPVSRFGDDGVHRVRSAKMLGTFLHMLQGTPYIYQGEELGMSNVRFPSIDDYRDIETLNMVREAVQQRGEDPAQVMAAVYAKSRDNARTPMQWDDSPNAGFSTGTPWIGLNPNYTEVNARQAQGDPGSVFHYYRALIRLRRAHPVIVQGRYDLLLPEHPQIFAFTRTLGAERLLVILNFSARPALFEMPAEMPAEMPGVGYSAHELLIGNVEPDAGQDLHRLTLQAYEARVHRLR